MTLTQLIWKLERFIRKANCFKCWHYNNELGVCSLITCIECHHGRRVGRTYNCMYYKKSGWFK